MSRRLLLTAWLLLSLAGGRAAAQTASAPGAAPAPDAAAAAEPAPQHTLGRYLHVDARLFPQENPPQVDRFLLRRVRPSFKGVLWEHYRYKFLVDVASSTCSCSTRTSTSPTSRGWSCAPARARCRSASSGCRARPPSTSSSAACPPCWGPTATSACSWSARSPATR